MTWLSPNAPKRRIPLSEHEPADSTAPQPRSAGRRAQFARRLRGQASILGAAVGVAVLAAPLVSVNGDSRSAEHGTRLVNDPWSDGWLAELEQYEPREPAVADAVIRHRRTWLELMAALGPLVEASPSRLSVALFVWALDDLNVDLDNPDAVNEWLTDNRIERVCDHVRTSDQLTSRPTLRDQHLVKIGMDRGVEGLTPRNRLKVPLAATAGWHTPAQQWQFMADAERQPTRHKRELLGKILTLGYGAGLASVEMGLIGEADVVDIDGIVWINVPSGDKPRRVPVDADYADIVLGLRNLPGSNKFFGDFTNDQWLSCAVHEGRWSTADAPRMRAIAITWLRNRVAAEANLSAVFAASQWRTLRVFSRCLDEADLVTTGQWRSVTRPHPDSGAPRG